MTFRDRIEAGLHLAELFAPYAGRNDLLVLGIPRGGVPVAFQVASALHAPLDIFLSAKLPSPGNEELAFGAVAAGDGRYLDHGIIQSLGLSHELIEQITLRIRQKLDGRAEFFRKGRPALPVTGKTVLLIDDGIATGASISAAIHALREASPHKVVVGAPVAPRSTANRLRREADDFVCVQTPVDLYAVGQFYQSFGATSDEEVIDLLNRSSQLPQTTPAPQ